MSNINFDHVRREAKPSVIAILNKDIPSIEHWMEHFNVTGWTICDAKTVKTHMGSDYPIETTLPVWPDMPEFSRTNQVSYFASFYNKTDIEKKLHEILNSEENAEWKQQQAAKAAKERAYQEAFARDPGPFDFRNDLK